MRKSLLALMAVSILWACNSGKEKVAEKKVKYNEMEAEMLKGNITSFEETPFKTDSTGKPGEMDTCCVAKAEIDENGNYISWSEKNSKGTLKNAYTYSRYEDGLFKGMTENKEGKTASSLTTSVDSAGKYTLAVAYDSAGKLDKYYTGLTQNEFGNVLTWKEYDKDSVFRQEAIATFNKSLQTSFTMKDSTGKVKQTVASQYNDKGELTERKETTVGKDSTTTKTENFTYETHDEMGNWTQRTTWEKGKATKVIRRTYTYRKEEEKK